MFAGAESRDWESLAAPAGKGEVSKPGAAGEEVGVLQIHRFFFHGFVLRLHILLLHCKGADKAVIKENKGLGSNTPFCKGLSARSQPHVSPEAGRKRAGLAAAPSYFWLCLIPDPTSSGESILWSGRWNKRPQVSLRARKVVRGFLPHSQNRVVALVRTPVCQGLG